MRDDFKEPVKDVLAKRAGMRCSNPNCRQLTSGPRKRKDKSVNIGVAAHIHAASPGGPRYNSKMSRAERISINNAIWLCQNCSKLIDNDADRYTPTVLVEWKGDAETSAVEELEGIAEVSAITKSPATSGNLQEHSSSHSHNRILQSKHVLLVEDDTYLADDLDFFFSDAGLNPLIANSFEDAVTLMNQYGSKVDLAILDFMMRRPKDVKYKQYFAKNEETGVGLARWILKHYPYVKIVGLTASSTKEDCAAWFEKNCSGFFYKPINERVLKELIAFIIKIRKATELTKASSQTPKAIRF